MDTLYYIKRLLVRNKYKFTAKAAAERYLDGLDEEDVIESIMNGGFIQSKKSNSADRAHGAEKIHIIEGFTYDGILVYTKGVIKKENHEDVFYLLVASNSSTRGRRKS